MESKQSPPQPNDVESFVGSLFADRYRIAHVISEGVTTLVAQVIDEQTGRHATLKVVRARLSAQPALRSRFDATMKGVAAMSHPNIAAVYDWGFAPIGSASVAYVVVEELNGGSLRDLFDRGRRLSPSQALTIGLDACRALDYAHRRGFVHGELTPGKVMFGDDRRLRIVDFGLSQLLADQAWDHLDSLPTHVAWYAAPEQGPGQTIDGKADVYALSLILHEAVTGNLPFKSDSTVATLAARQNKLMPVSADLGALAAVLERSGRPEPEERSSAAELGAGLVRAASKLPRPEPLPLLTSGLFEVPPEEMRSPSDPTGGVRRPEPVEPELIVVPADVDEVSGEPEAPVAAAAPVEIVDDSENDSEIVDAEVLDDDEIVDGEIVVIDDALVDQAETVETVEIVETVETLETVDAVDAVAPDTGPAAADATPDVVADATLGQLAGDSDGFDETDEHEDFTDVDGGLPFDDHNIEVTAVTPIIEADGATPAASDEVAEPVATNSPASSAAETPPVADPAPAAPAATPPAKQRRPKNPDKAAAQQSEPAKVDRDSAAAPNVAATAATVASGAAAATAAGQSATAKQRRAATPDTAAAVSPKGTRPAAAAQPAPAQPATASRRPAKPAAATPAAKSAAQPAPVTGDESAADQPKSRKQARADKKRAAKAAAAAAAAAAAGVSESTSRRRAGATPQPVESVEAVVAVESASAPTASDTSRPAVPAPPVIVEADPDLDIDAPVGGDLVIVPVADTVIADDADVTTEISSPDKAPRRRRGRKAKVLVALLILLALAALAGLAYVLFRTPTHAVPNLVGQPQSQAAATIEPFGWNVTVQNERSDVVPEAGSIVRTVPAAGVDVPEGDPFLLVVSDGPVLRELPEFTGMTSVEAQTEIRDLKLIADVSTAFDENVAAEDVASWEVEGQPGLVAGDLVEPNNTVKLVVSDGPAPREVPEIVNKTADEAAQALGALKLVPMESGRQFSNDVPEGVVISQQPDPGTSVARDSTVTFVVSKGPDLVAVPTLAEDLSYDEAYTILTEAGFQVKLVLGDAQGTVVKYEIDGEPIEAGQTYLRGTQIDITAA